MINRFLYWFRTFMSGRYGNDGLNIALMILYIILSLVARFSLLWPLYYISLLLLVLVFLRMLSRNIPARSRENQAFFKVFGPLINTVKNAWRHSKDTSHRYYHCPKCRHQLRVPRGRGKIKITCPTCRHEFIKNS